MIKKLKCYLLFGIILFGFKQVQAGGSNSFSDTTKFKRNSFFALPLVYFSPETNWAFGGAGIYAFRLKAESDTSRPSQIQGGLAYTLNKQVLSYLSYQIFIKDQLYRLYGEMGYYRYSYFFYGNGNSNTLDDGELYKVNYPRLRINALYKLKPNWYAGFRYWLDDYRIAELAVGGLLKNNKITGSDGGLLSGLGVVMNYDTRDNIFSPSKGFFMETVLFANSKVLGSDFNFNKIYLDASVFFSNKWQQVLAVNFYAELTAGTVPFNQLALMGGGKKMRGYYEGRFRDNHLLLLQAEYRLPLFWRLGLVVFGGYGAVAHRFTDFNKNNFRYTYGAGLRISINQTEKINIRIDAGFGKNTSGYYLTIGEAF